MSIRRSILVAVLALGATAALAGPAQKAVIDHYTAGAGTAGSPERGKALFLAAHSGGKPDTPSCTTCHGMDLAKAGKTRAGKPIEPLAPSANAKRLTDVVEVEKWLTRNCDSVLGRACSPTEKADVVAYLAGL